MKSITGLVGTNKVVDSRGGILSSKKIVLQHVVVGRAESIAIDSTGVKIEAKGLKAYLDLLEKIVLRASWSQTATDATVKICIADSSGVEILCVQGSGGTLSNELTDLSSLSDGMDLVVKVEVATASATSGATATIDYIVVEFHLGF